MLATEHTQSLADFRQKAAETLDRINQTDEAEIITVDGRIRAILLSPAAYLEMADEAEAAGFRRALQQHAAGDSMEMHAFMDTVRTNLLDRKAARGTAGDGE